MSPLCNGNPGLWTDGKRSRFKQCCGQHPIWQSREVYDGYVVDFRLRCQVCGLASDTGEAWNIGASWHRRVALRQKSMKESGKAGDHERP